MYLICTALHRDRPESVSLPKDDGDGDSKRDLGDEHAEDGEPEPGQCLSPMPIARVARSQDRDEGDGEPNRQRR